VFSVGTGTLELSRVVGRKQATGPDRHSLTGSSAGGFTLTEHEYVLGTDAVELERLGVQHRLWSDAAAALWRRAGIGPGSSVLDVGCGPGYASLDLAQLVGRGGRVVGVDLSARFIDEASRRAGALAVPQARFHACALADLEAALGDEVFDAAYARWVLCFAPDTGGVLDRVAGHLKPGGRLLVQDYFNYRAFTAGPHDERFGVFQRAVETSWRDGGGDPDVVGKLPGLLLERGFEIEHFAVHQRIARPGETMWAWPDTWIRSFSPRLVESGHMTSKEQADLLGLWEEMSVDPSRFLVPPPVWDVVARKTV
jgi:SAM-dependent methyltransferase